MRRKARPAEAIREKDDIERLRAHYREKYENGEMYALLVTIGCNTGLRAGDLRRLKIGDFRRGDYLELIEQKTGKERRIYINEAVRKALEPYNMGLASGHVYFDEYPLFMGAKCRPIEVKHMHKILKAGCRAIGLTGNFGSHTLRKTFAFHAFESCHSATVIKRLFDHSTMAVTRVYLNAQQNAEPDALRMPVRVGELLKRDLDYVYASLSL